MHNRFYPAGGIGARPRSVPAFVRRFTLLLVLLPVVSIANEVSYRTLQSGSPTGPTPLHDRGLHGEGQIIAFLDAGLDYDNCYFAETDNSAPPINLGTPGGGYQSSNIDYNRRKVIAYDFLYSCAQFPGAPDCQDPQNPEDYDERTFSGHGTHHAGSAAGDKGAPIFHDFGDSVAPAAKLIVQDAGGYNPADACSLLAGLGCPITMLDDALDLAYRQGARIHSNAWGDRQGNPINPPRANYSTSARDVDAFVASHPDMVVLFNTGNFTSTTGATAPPSTVSAPGVAKNTIQVGGTRGNRFEHRADDVLWYWRGVSSNIGPTRDGRIKPDVVGPASVIAGDSDFDIRTNNCNTTQQEGTSWASPSLAGAVALIRQYYLEGFYPSGRRSASGMSPSAALVKATLIASARRVPFKVTNEVSLADTPPVPNYEQGFGFPVLDDALYFAGDQRRLLVFDLSSTQGLLHGGSFTQTVNVRAGSTLKAVLVWTDPAGVAVGPTDPRMQLVNDLDLIVRDASGRISYGNERLHPGAADRLNNVEAVELGGAAGTFQIEVRAHRVQAGPRQSFALVLVGDFADTVQRRRAIRR